MFGRTEGQTDLTLITTQRDHSMLTFESEQFQGSKAVVDKLQALPFQKVQHKVSTLDAQPSSPSVASIIVLVTGQLIVDECVCFHRASRSEGFF